jgi:hypothetical protein
MANYPIRIYPEGCRGSDPKKRKKVAGRNRIAAELEKHINSEIKKRGGGVYSYAEIAYATGYDVEVVRKICFPIACGSNGFSVAEPSSKTE